MNNMRIYWSEIYVFNCKAQKIVIKPCVMHWFMLVSGYFWEKNGNMQNTM